MKDLYALLGVPEDESQEGIKKAYRRLAKEYHPDATGGDKRKTERFKEIGEAYAVLGDEKKRREYDRLRRAPVGADGMPESFDADLFSQIFGGGGHPGGVRVETSFGSGDLGDVFSSLFGGDRGGRRGSRATRGADMVGRLDVTFAEAARGTRRTLQSAAGRPIEVRVPPGVETGGRLRVPRQGAPGIRGGPPGDLHLEVVVAPDPYLRRTRGDIEVDLPLGVAEATLGAKVEVPTVDGPVEVVVPPGTSSGARLRLRGKGIGPAGGDRGDQLCIIQVMVPKLRPDDAEAHRLLEEFVRHTRSAPVRRFGKGGQT